MSDSLIHIEHPTAEPPFVLTQAQARLRQMVLDSVLSIHSKRNYAKALDDLFAFSASRPLSRALRMEYRTSMENLSPSTINVRMSAIRKLVGEARRNGLIEREEADNLTDVPNVRQTGRRLGKGYGNDSVQNGPFAEYNGSGHRIPEGSWAMGSLV
jgi:hypothetical protein